MLLPRRSAVMRGCVLLLGRQQAALQSGCTCAARGGTLSSFAGIV
jgi:hypothetical protein